MRDGYYLSTYLGIGELSHLKDLFLRHDQSIALWKKEKDYVTLMHYWELERLTGLKQHNRSFFNMEQVKQVINGLLSAYNLGMDDMVEIWGTPQLQTGNDYHSGDQCPDFPFHSIAHLFSGIMMDSDIFRGDTIIGLAVDGGPDSVFDSGVMKKYLYAGCIAEKGVIREIFPVSSPGFLWVIASNHYKLREGTLMALASASKSEIYMEQGEALEFSKFGDYAKTQEYFDHVVQSVGRLTEQDAGILFNQFDSLFTEEENKTSMVMKEIQKMSFRIMERNIDDILNRYKVNPREAYLSVSGGYALNCPTNSTLMQKYKFKGFLTPPCTSDTGIALGVGLYAFHKKMESIRFHMRHAFYGDEDHSLEQVLSSPGMSGLVKGVSGINVKQAVEDITAGPVVWFNGRAEVGPRALGNRSILADPRNNLSKDVLNKIKGREWWRPVAPIVIEEDAGEWFEDVYSSPFMLHTFRILPGKAHLIPAIAHLDTSSRVQTLKAEDNPLLYGLLLEFKRTTGVPIICNTSLNDKGEPIINRIEEALNFALRKGIKAVYINGNRVELHNHGMYKEDKPSRRPIKFLVYQSEEEREQLVKQYNPLGVEDELLGLYYEHFSTLSGFKPDNPQDIKKLKRMRMAMDRRADSYHF